MSKADELKQKGIDVKQYSEVRLIQNGVEHIILPIPDTFEQNVRDFYKWSESQVAQYFKSLNLVSFGEFCENASIFGAMLIDFSAAEIQSMIFDEMKPPLTAQEQTLILTKIDAFRRNDLTLEQQYVQQQEKSSITIAHLSKMSIQLNGNLSTVKPLLQKLQHVTRQ